MKNNPLKKHQGILSMLILFFWALTFALSTQAQSISPAAATVSGGDCNATGTPNLKTFTLTTATPANPGYSWRIGCPATNFPPGNTIKAVGGTSNAGTCAASGEILNSGTNKTITLEINNLVAGEIYSFTLEVFDASGAATHIISQEITITASGDCVAPVCCLIGAVPATGNQTRDPGVPFTTIAFDEDNNTTTGLTWKIQREDPGMAGNFIDVVNLAELPGVGLSNGIGGPFNLLTSNEPVVYLGGTANGVIGKKAKMRIHVSKGGDEDTSPEFTYAIGDPLVGNALIIPVRAADNRVSPPSSIASCTSTPALDPLAFKTVVNEACTWLNTVSYTTGSPKIQPVLYSNTVIGVAPDLKDHFNRLNEADDFAKFVRAVMAELNVDPAVLAGKTNLILALDNCLESKEGKIAHYATMKSIEIPIGGALFHVSVHAKNNTWKDVAHSLSNNFAIKDVFDLVPPSAPGRPTLNDWDEMAKTYSEPMPFSGAQPSAFSKLWPSEKWIEFNDFHSINPAVGAPQPLKIVFPHFTSLNTGEKRAIAVLIQNNGSSALGTTTQQFVVIEARDKTVPDNNLKAGNGGVIYYLADKLIPEGYSPITHIGPLTNFPLIAGDITSDSHDLFTRHGIKVTAIADYSVGGTQRGYTVTLQVTEPPKSDITIDVGDPSWTSPDIAVEIQGKSGGVCNAGDIFSTTLQNKINATITNKSMTIAAVNVHAKFLFGCPTTTSFNFYEVGSVLVGEVAKTADATASIILNPGQAYPKQGGGTPLKPADCITAGASHICVKVELSSLNDVNTGNNIAQQNLQTEATCTGSPYSPLDNVFMVRNKESYRTPIYLKAEQIPSNWTHEFIPPSLNLGPDEEARVTLRLTPPDGFPFCSDFSIPVTAWAPKGHTIVQLGGLSLIAQLRQGTKMTMQNRVGPCKTDSDIKTNADIRHNNVGAANDNNNVNNIKNVYHHYNQGSYLEMFNKYLTAISRGGKKNERECSTIYTNGCTEPKRPNQLVKVMYQDPAGNPVIKEVMTDANGCFSDEFTTLEGGTWNITAIYNGDECIGGAMTDTLMRVPIGETGDQDNDNTPDKDEVQGDYDSDNLPGQLDPDSDNDTVLDGDEPTGDFDCDGLPNMVDPDSDNDGTKDGSDNTPYGNTPRYKVFLSAMYHRFDFSSDLPIKDGSGFNIRAGMNFNPKWGLEAEAGFTSTEDIEKKSGNVTNVNLNALYYLKSASLTPYLTAGGGALLFNGFTVSDNTFALNGGAGIFFAPSSMSGALALRAEIKGHYGFGGYDTSGNFNIQYALGIAYRIRTKSTPCNLDKRSKDIRKK